MTLKRIFKLAFVLLTVSMIVASCNMGSYPGFKKTKSGVYYKIHEDNKEDTALVRTGSIVTMYLKYGAKDSALFDSKEMPEPIVLPIMESQYEGDFYDIMTMFKQGDSVTFILKAGPLFTTTFQQPSVPEPFTEESDIYFDIAIYKVQSQEEVDKEVEVKNMQMEQEEMARLETYVTEKGISQQPSSTGVYYLESKKGTGKSPMKDGYVSAHFSVSLLGGEQLFSTHDRGEEPIEFKYGSQFENPGFQEVIGLMKEGGRANAIVPSSMAFGAQGAGSVVPPFSTLYYDIELVKVLSPEEYQKKQEKKEAEKRQENAKREKDEDALIQKYIKDNNITPTISMPNGLVFVETVAGSGPKPEMGKKVKVHYTGKLLDGTKFDSSVDRGEPFEFTLGRGAVIEGWDQGLALMNVGDKGLLIIPSRLAYKDRGAGNLITPYTPLVFEVELIEAEK